MKTTIIAEIGLNHNGNMEMAKCLIDEVLYRGQTTKYDIETVVIIVLSRRQRISKYIWFYFKRFKLLSHVICCSHLFILCR